MYDNLQRLCLWKFLRIPESLGYKKDASTEAPFMKKNIY